ncbi:hypothetical protein cypCar_00034689 [Cyprinus carpio]|nr:hypothetical protein cypCar_00034689 [Cyprinus carpio]
MFSVVIDAFGVDTDGLSVMEGDSVTLHTDVKMTQQDRIRWYFNSIRIAEIIYNHSKICTDDQCKERFRDRLQLDSHTGDLTITNTRTTDAGVYKLLMNSRNSERIFNVAVSVETREEEITYAEPTFYKRKAQKGIVKEEDNVVYSSVVI